MYYEQKAFEFNLDTAFSGSLLQAHVFDFGPGSIMEYNIRWCRK